jgi:CBS domain-containing protein
MLRVVIDEIPALKETICVRDCMTTTVITITPETSILEAHRLMAVERIRSLPVVEGEQLAGLVTRTDLLSADHPVWLDDTRDKELALRVEVEDVRRIMSTKLITITPQEGVVQAAGLMLRNKIHCLPVLNDQGGLVGILTETDLFRLITRKFF